VSKKKDFTYDNGESSIESGRLGTIIALFFLTDKDWKCNEGSDL
jgi:hypothetical protein